MHGGAGRGGLHRRRSRKVAAGLLTVLAAIAAVWISAAAPSATAETTKGYDGTALVLGLFFGLGPVAESYPDLVLTRVEDTPEQRAHLDQVIADVRQTRPGHLDEFRSAMYSGDPAVIGEAASLTVTLLYNTVAAPNGTAGGVGGGDPIDALEEVAELPAPMEPIETGEPPGTAGGKPNAVSTDGKPNVHPTITRWAARVANTLQPVP